MGVPALFRWLSNKYPKIVSPVIEEKATEIEGEKVPVDITKPNPNGLEYDNLYLDMNGIVHPCSHPEDRPPPADEEEMMKAIFEYTDRVVNMVRPRKLLMIAIDGVAPRAKMNQQRSRRFRAAQEAQEKDESNKELIQLMKQQAGGSLEEGREEAITKKTWDSNQITPGTPFMQILADSLRYWCRFKLNTDPGWAQLKIIISDASVPGEGEHKIMEFIRSQRNNPQHDPNTRHVLYGLDADLIMLGLATHEPHFHVLREDVFFQEASARTCHLCGQKGHKAFECKGEAKPKDGEFDEKDKAVSQKPFIWLHVSILREYLAVEMRVPEQSFDFDLERALDDWVFMCFFCGNDFLPHLPSLEIRENGIDTLIGIWRRAIPAMGGYVTKDGHVDFAKAQHILDGLARQEDSIFQKRRKNEERMAENAKRRKLEKEQREQKGDDRRPRRRSPDYSPMGANGSAPLALFAPGKGETVKDAKVMTYEMAVNRGPTGDANAANKSAAAMLKSKMLGKDSDKGENAEPTDSPDAAQTPPSALGKRKADMIEEDASSTPGRSTPEVNAKPAPDDEMPADTVRLWEDGYADRYYEQKFDVDPKNVTFRNKVALAYAEGLAWVLRYYFQGCPSWSWYYPYHYAPFAADFVDLDQFEVNFEKSAPLRPYEQLMGVLPAASNTAIPEPFRSLMSDEDSEIIDFYPTDFKLDLNGKKFAWQGVAILPFIDIKRLLAAMAQRYPLLTEAQVFRNELGNEVLLFSEQHPLHYDVAANFYSKRRAVEDLNLDMKVSGGLAGSVKRDPEHAAQAPLTTPIEGSDLEELDVDNSMSVYYVMPPATHVHKSMLLNGVKLPTPSLNQNDIHETMNQTRKSGNQRGRGGYNGRGGGPGHYQNQRPNNNSRPPYPPQQPPGFPPPSHGGWAPPPPPPGMHAPFPGNGYAYQGSYGGNGYDHQGSQGHRPPQQPPPPQGWGQHYPQAPPNFPQQYRRY